MKERLIPAGHAGEAYLAFKAATGAEVNEETIASRLRRGGTASTGTVLVSDNGERITLED